MKGFFVIQMKDYPLYDAPVLNNYAEFFAYLADFKDKTAFTFKMGDTLTTRSYEQFLSDVRALHAAFEHLGLCGQHISLVGETSYEWIVSNFALCLCGGVIVPIDKALPDAEIKNIIVDSESTGLMFSKTYQSVAASIDDGDFLLFPLFGDTPDAFDALLEQGYELLASGSEKEYYAATDEDVSVLMYTSGTTGRQKGIMLSQKNLLMAALGAIPLLDRAEVCVSTLPMHHSYEFSHGLLMMLVWGVNICLSESIRHFVPDLQTYRPDCVCLVPQYLEMLRRNIYAHYQKQGQDVDEMLARSNTLFAQGEDRRAEIFADVHALLGGRIRYLISGGAPLSAQMMRFFRELGIPVLNGYGISECAPLVSVNRNRDYCDGSVGLPIACVTIDVRNADESGEGEIWVKGPNVMLGYYKNEEATREVMDGEFFNTGDIGHIVDKYLFITGRAKNMIILSNGKNVYPEEIEDELRNIPGVAEVVVFAKSAEDGTDLQLAAEFYLADGRTDEAARSELKPQVEAVCRKMPAFKRVTEILLRGEPFPKTTTSKIKRFCK